MAGDTQRSGQRRWGLWTLAFLGLAALSLFFYDDLRAQGLALLTTLGLLIGLIGAVVCTVRGLRGSGLPRNGR